MESAEQLTVPLVFRLCWDSPVGALGIPDAGVCRCAALHHWAGVLRSTTGLFQQPEALVTILLCFSCHLKKDEDKSPSRS